MNKVARNYSNYFPSVFESVFGNNAVNQYLHPNHNGNVPAVNVLEMEDAFKIELAAPGLKKEDFKLSLDRNQLTISSKKSENLDKEAPKVKYNIKEFSFSSFQRTFTIPTKVETEKIAANYENGILVVTLPKREEPKVQLTREIEIA